MTDGNQALLILLLKSVGSATNEKHLSHLPTLTYPQIFTAKHHIWFPCTLSENIAHRGLINLAVEQHF